MNPRDALSILVPRPRRVVRAGRRHRFAGGLVLGPEVPSPRLRAAALRVPRVREGGMGAALELAVDASTGAGRPGAYTLVADARGVVVRGADEAGVFYGLATLAQLLGQRAEGIAQGRRERGEVGTSVESVEHDDFAVELDGVAIEDAPDFRARAVSLDVNRDKVPTLATLFALVDRLAAWKVNQLQLYMEHVFAYVGHEEVWRDASPFTPADIRALDVYCHERFVELVPNQNSLAHFHRWLVHPRYRDLAEVPEGIVHPFSHEPEPFSLCPTDERTFALLADLYDQLLPNFTSRLFNVGLDEPIDLGKGRSKRACDASGSGRLFLDYLVRVRDMVAERGRTMQFWADWILLHPELVPELPKDVIAMEWGYEADHPFDKEQEVLAKALERRYVCPGTSSWNSICGRHLNAFANLMRAGRVGRRFSCEGYLVADWGDHGHWQPLPVSYPGLLFGACVAWNGDEVPGPSEVAELLDVHVFGMEGSDLEGSTRGKALLQLGMASREARTRCINGSAPFFLLHFAHEGLPHPRLEGLTVPGLERVVAALDDAMSGLVAAGPPACAEAELASRELELAGDLARAGCRLGLARLRANGAACAALPAEERRSLASDLDALAERHRALWLARNRPGGIRASAGRITRVARLLDPH